MRSKRQWTWPLYSLPLAWLLWAAFDGQLGANPIESINRFLGDWALYFLLLTLACTPLHRRLGWTGVMALRKGLGLAAFFYASLHLCSYIILDQFFDWAAIFSDIIKRPYISLGFIAFSMLSALALTSTKRAKQRLGARRWKQLHRLVYPLTALVLLHYYLMLKADKGPVLVPLVVFVLLMVARLRPIVDQNTRTT